jgi:hypothetical protein
MIGKVLFDMLPDAENLPTGRQAASQAIKATGCLIN